MKPIFNYWLSWELSHASIQWNSWAANFMIDPKQWLIGMEWNSCRLGTERLKNYIFYFLALEIYVTKKFSSCNQTDGSE